MTPIEQGIFYTVGDQYTLKLSPLINILSIQSYDDYTVNTDGTHTFTKEFRYSLNNGATFTSWATLTDLALQGISVTLNDTILMEIRYTRAGTADSTILYWRKFLLDDIQVEAHVVLRLNKTEYDTVYGEDKYVNILSAITTFNEWSMEATGIFVYVKDDNTVTGQAIAIDNVIHGNSRDIDFNMLLRTEFGKRLVKVFNDLDINPNTPRV